MVNHLLRLFLLLAKHFKASADFCFYKQPALFIDTPVMDKAQSSPLAALSSPASLHQES